MREINQPLVNWPFRARALPLGQGTALIHFHLVSKDETTSFPEDSYFVAKHLSIFDFTFL